MEQFEGNIITKLPQTGTSIFAVMSGLANEHKAVNLSQGFPDFPISAELIDVKSQNYVRLTIGNNGPNIPEELLEKIKMPFFTTKTAENGTGLGLCISIEIIEEHGGTFDIESILGEYTEMII